MCHVLPAHRCPHNSGSRAILYSSYTDVHMRAARSLCDAEMQNQSPTLAAGMITTASCPNTLQGKSRCHAKTFAASHPCCKRSESLQRLRQPQTLLADAAMRCCSSVGPVDSADPSMPSAHDTSDLLCFRLRVCAGSTAPTELAVPLQALHREARLGRLAMARSLPLA